MKTFRCKADFTFEAEDIEGAMLVLSEHFLNVIESEFLPGRYPHTDIILSGGVIVEPLA